MSGVPLNDPVKQWFGASGLPLAFGSVKTYLAGTTSFLPAYSDYALAVPYGPSIPLDAQGKAPIYLGPFVYKIDVQDQFGVSIDGYPKDNVPGSSFIGLTYDVKFFGAKGDGVTDDTLAIQAAINALSPVDAVGAAGWALYFSPGRYRITSSLTMTGRASVKIFGEGVDSAILNQAPASNPTFNLNGKQFFLIENLAILGSATFPNDAISGPSTGFGRFNNLFLCPNGNGIHLSDANTIAIDNCQYWPSGYNAGASRTAALCLNGILGDGVTCNDIHIRWFNCVGQTTIANGGSAIKFNPSSNANNVTVLDCELEGTPPQTAHAAFSFTKVFSFTLQSNFIENTTSAFLNCQQGMISQNQMGGSTASLVFGDGSVGNRCGQITCDSLSANAITITANCYAVGCTNCTLQTFTDSSVQSYFFNGSIASEGATSPDRGFPFGLRERSRTKALGEWIAPAFNAAIFTAQAGTWTVIAGNVLVFSYTLVGKTMTLCFGLDSTTVAGGPSSYLQFTIPGGFLPNIRTETTTRAFNNSGAVAAVGTVEVFVGNAQLRLRPSLIDSTVTWANAAALCSVFGQIEFEIQ